MATPDKRFQETDTEQVWILDSDVPGPTIIFLGGVHGNERAGIEIIKQMVSGEFPIRLLRGKLMAVLGNVAAIEANVRFTEGGTNLNREFTNVPKNPAIKATSLSTEPRRAKELKPYLLQADAAVDFHGFRQIDGRPYIITEPRGFRAALIVSQAGAEYISSGWGGPEGIEQGGTNDFMERQGKVGLSVELSQLEDLEKGVPLGEEIALRFLQYMDMIDPVFDSAHGKTTREPTFVHATKAVLAKPDFRWGPNFPYHSFQRVDYQFIARNGPNSSDQIFAGPNQVIIFPSSDEQPKPGDEMFNLGTIIKPSIDAVT
jgi:predicted deacylase